MIFNDFSNDTLILRYFNDTSQFHAQLAKNPNSKLEAKYQEKKHICKVLVPKYKNYTV